MNASPVLPCSQRIQKYPSKPRGRGLQREEAVNSKPTPWCRLSTDSDTICPRMVSDESNLSGRDIASFVVLDSWCPIGRQRSGSYCASVPKSAPLSVNQSSSDALFLGARSHRYLLALAGFLQIEDDNNNTFCVVGLRSRWCSYSPLSN